MRKEHGLRQLEEAEIDAIVAEIEAEKAAAEAAKKAPQKETQFHQGYQSTIICIHAVSKASSTFHV